jgi:peptidoglycan/LPS O-acetylase OafA/YrhL
MQFYAFFPLIYLAARRYPLWIGAGLLGLGAMVLTKLYAIGVAGSWWPGFDEPSLLTMKLPFFLVGMLIYEAGRARSLACLGVGAGLLLLACRGYGLGAALLVLLIGAMAGLWLAGTPAALRKLARSSLVRFLSDCSYCVYLVHGLVLAIVGSRLLASVNEAGFSPSLAVAILAATVIPLSYAIAWAAYRFVELPGIALGTAVAGREAQLGAGLRRRAAALGLRARRAAAALTMH